MELKNINLNRKDFLSFFIYRHKKNWTIYSFPIVFVMIFVLFIYGLITAGINLGVIACLFTLIVGITYIIAVFKTCKSYENQPFDLEINKGEYKMIRNKKVTFRQDLEKFYCYDETKNHYFLFVDKTKTFVLRKSLFDEENLTFLTNQIHKKVRRRNAPILTRIISAVLGVSSIAFVVLIIIGLL